MKRLGIICLICVVSMMIGCDPESLAVRQKNGNIDLGNILSKRDVNSGISGNKDVEKVSNSEVVVVPNDVIKTGDDVCDNKSARDGARDVDFQYKRQPSDRNEAYRLLKIRLEFCKEDLYSTLDEVESKRAGFDPEGSLFGGQNVSEELLYYNTPLVRERIYLILGKDIEKIKILQSIFKNFNLSVNIRDSNYENSETEFMVRVLNQLCGVSNIVYMNLAHNFSDKNIDLIGKKSLDEINKIRFKLDEFMELKNNIFDEICDCLYLAQRRKDNKASMVVALGKIVDPNGLIASSVNRLNIMLAAINYLIYSNLFL
ncbi:hypothetical protein baBA2_000924 (plasmid) [Borrelia anserina]|uniref:Lipoprotein n=1 Tax=Borrelia anserina Es TaxID=1365188 RepID=A0ABM6FVM0_BORAN|nr:hypothetical protein [Borrelia anserina]APR65330.1 hypothetical protein N187_A11 [Borrelia anserina Es]UPA07298.1 hypothetical protein baBA2_000924 [Borrelia anserina]